MVVEELRWLFVRCVLQVFNYYQKLHTFPFSSSFLTAQSSVLREEVEGTVQLSVVFCIEQNLNSSCCQSLRQWFDFLCLC